MVGVRQASESLAKLRGHLLLPHSPLFIPVNALGKVWGNPIVFLAIIIKNGKINKSWIEYPPQL